MVRASPRSTRVAEFEVFDRRALSCRVPLAEQCCRSGFSCMRWYRASSRSWSTQAFDNANYVGPATSTTGRHRSSMDLRFHEFLQTGQRLTTRLKISIGQSLKWVECGLEHSWTKMMVFLSVFTCAQHGWATGAFIGRIISGFWDHWTYHFWPPFFPRE